MDRKTEEGRIHVRVSGGKQRQGKIMQKVGRETGEGRIRVPGVEGNRKMKTMTDILIPFSTDTRTVAAPPASMATSAPSPFPIAAWRSPIHRSAPGT